MVRAQIKCFRVRSPLQMESHMLQFARVILNISFSLQDVFKMTELVIIQTRPNHTDVFDNDRRKNEKPQISYMFQFRWAYIGSPLIAYYFYQICHHNNFVPILYCQDLHYVLCIQKVKHFLHYEERIVQMLCFLL